MNKILLAIIFLFLLQSALAQKYSALIKDSTIINFMTWVIPTDTSSMVNNKIFSDSGERIYNDSVKLIYERYWLKIFSQFNLSAFLGPQDAKYFAEQVSQMIAPSQWDLPFGSFYNDVGSMQPGKRFHSFSIPLFSLNKKYAVVQWFYSFSVKSGGNYSCLYQKQEDNSWKRLRLLDGWGE